MKPARLLPYLAVALAAALLVVAGVVAGWHTAAAPDAAALRRELLEGVVPAAAPHEQLRERVARQDVIIAELAEDSKETGASVVESRKTVKIVQSTVDEMGARLLDVEGALSEEGEGLRRQMQGAEPEPEPEPAQGDYVLQIKREVTRGLCPLDSDTNDGHFDMSRCGDPASPVLPPSQSLRDECVMRVVQGRRHILRG